MTEWFTWDQLSCQYNKIIDKIFFFKRRWYKKVSKSRQKLDETWRVRSKWDKIHVSMAFFQRVIISLRRACLEQKVVVVLQGWGDTGRVWDCSNSRNWVGEEEIQKRSEPRIYESLTDSWTVYVRIRLQEIWGKATQEQAERTEQSSRSSYHYCEFKSCHDKEAR